MSTSFTAQATNSAGQSQGAAQTVVSGTTTFTGTVPVGNGTAYTIVPTTGLPPGSVWRWSYVQFSATGVRQALAWGQFTKDVNGTIAAANAAGGADLAELVTTGGTVTPATIAYGAGVVQLTTNAGNTAQGNAWTCTVSRWV